ncbi:MAG TPA: zf-HC2 domain-containing protein [Oculatellaceae cyanobacterium]
MEDVCVKYRSELSALVDGQLDAKVQTEMQAHITDCESCSQEFETLKSLEQFLGENMFSDDVAVPEIWDLLQAELPSVCDVIRDDLSSFIDGELPPPAHEGVDKHLKECLPCMSAYKELNNVTKLIAKNLELPLSIKVDLWPAVKARLNEDCALIQGELSAYADQEVEILRHRTITKHLVDCTECKGSFESISSVGELLRDSYRPAVADDFDLWPEVKRQLQVVPITLKSEQQTATPAAQTKTKFKTPRLFVASAAAVVVLMVASTTAFVGLTKHKVVPLSSEAYLIESSMSQPTEIAEAVIYDPEQ